MDFSNFRHSKDPQEGVGNGLQHSFTSLANECPTAVCMCLHVYTCLCVHTHVSERRREQRNTEKAMRSLSASLCFIEAMETLVLFKRIMGEISSETLNENKCIDAGKD